MLGVELCLGVCIPMFNGFFTSGDSSMLPSDRDNRLIHNLEGSFCIERFTKHVNIHMYRIMTCDQNATVDLDISLPNNFQFKLLSFILISVGVFSIAKYTHGMSKSFTCDVILLVYPFLTLCRMLDNISCVSICQFVFSFHYL